ncbi:hypothetical protein MAR_008033 [Mya arenaria]|uniref:Uncharacterized protein n=1 Tax=Mya arenaria TaxID=6604 RepID=A0ABY7DUT2_MYAAR|nr:hypothetical protein MAR_008033 [Mya arenaria]
MYRMRVFILNYLDDLARAEMRDLAIFSYTWLGQSLSSCGLEKSVRSDDILGVLFNTKTMTMKVTPERLTEIGGGNVERVAIVDRKIEFCSFMCKSELINWLKQFYELFPHVFVTTPIVTKDVQW